MNLDTGSALWVILITGDSVGTGRGIVAGAGGVAREDACNMVDSVLDATLG